MLYRYNVLFYGCRKVQLLSLFLSIKINNNARSILFILSEIAIYLFSFFKAVSFGNKLIDRNTVSCSFERKFALPANTKMLIFHLIIRRLTYKNLSAPQVLYKIYSLYLYEITEKILKKT